MSSPSVEISSHDTDAVEPALVNPDTIATTPVVKKAIAKPVKPKTANPRKEEKPHGATASGGTERQGGTGSVIGTSQAGVISASFNAAYLRNPAPNYPTVARRKGIEGEVLLRVRVSKEGRAETATVSQSSGSELLDEAARDAVLHWRFIPAQQGGESVAADVAVPIIFKIK